MNIPFTIEEFLDVLQRYNEAVWPTQLLLLILPLATAVAILRGPGVTRSPAFILAILWLWMGVVYHLHFFRSINPAAVLFGALFVIQAGLFAWLAIREPVTRFSVEGDANSLVGGLMILFSLAIYPALGYMVGHRYPAAATFGLPCPTTLFTLGLLLWARPAPPRVVLVIPLLWSLIATVAALQLDMVEDLSLPAAAILATVVGLKNERRTDELRVA